VALVGLCELLRADGDPRRVVDVQWQTPHLATLGVLEVTRDAYLAMLTDALRAPLPEPWR
jgi:leucyl/phenylalanyl-tRNA--protein transferase